MYSANHLSVHVTFLFLPLSQKDSKLTVWTRLQVTQKRKRERGGGRKKEEEGREREEGRKKERDNSDRPRRKRETFNSHNSRERASFSHGIERLPPLRFCLLALLCGHKMAAAFPQASRRPVFSLLRFFLSRPAPALTGLGLGHLPHSNRTAPSALRTAKIPAQKRTPYS